MGLRLVPIPLADPPIRRVVPTPPGLPVIRTGIAQTRHNDHGGLFDRMANAVLIAIGADPARNLGLMLGGHAMQEHPRAMIFDPLDPLGQFAQWVGAGFRRAQVRTTQFDDVRPERQQAVQVLRVGTALVEGDAETPSLKVGDCPGQQSQHPER